MYYSGYGCGPRQWREQQMQLSPVNIVDSGDEYTIHLYAPRLNKDQFELTTQQDILTVKYKEDNQSDKAYYTRKEYRPDEIARSFDLKGKVEIDGIKATYSDGVLIIHLPKTEAARKKAQSVNVS
jgi:HSP20 family protein